MKNKTIKFNVVLKKLDCYSNIIDEIKTIDIDVKNYDAHQIMKFLNKETNNDTSKLCKPIDYIDEFVKKALTNFYYQIDIRLFQSMICSYKSEPIMGVLEFVVRENYKNVMEWRIIDGK
jgi:hypothetical protein